MARWARSFDSTCSSSGKLTSSLVLYWRDQCLAPHIGDKSLLLSDSWSGQNDRKIYSDLLRKKKDVKRIMIPQHTTGELQPLDKYFNRQLKNFLKTLYHRVDMAERNNIIKFVSLVYDQLCAPVFQQMVQYSWYASGLGVFDPSPFSNINDVCFPCERRHAECDDRYCHETVFVTCAHCEKKLCFRYS